MWSILQDTPSVCLLLECEQKAGFLTFHFSDRRAPLMQFEIIRARRLLKTADATLIEIEQVQGEIGQTPAPLSEIG